MTIIIVVEPHAIYRLGMLQLIADVVPNLKSMAADYADLYASVGSTQKTDLVLLSLAESEDPGRLIDATLQAYAPRALLLLSDYGSAPEEILRHAAVCGYVPKNTDPDVLHAVIRLILAGGRCFPQRVKQLSPVLDDTPALASSDTSVPVSMPLQSGLIPDVIRHPIDDSPPVERPCISKLPLEGHEESEMLGLTPRQYEVLVLLSRGYPMKTVSRYLNISVATAKAHTETLYQRLDVHNRNAAVYAAISKGAKLGWECIRDQADLTSSGP